MWRSLLLVVLLACSSKRDAPKENQSSSTERGVAENSAGDDSRFEQGRARDILFVPAAIVNHLIGADTVVAVDLTRGDLSTFLALLPPEVDCAKALIKSLGVVVLAKSGLNVTVYATKLPEAQTRKCLDQLVPPMGGITRPGTERSYEVHMPTVAVTFTWQNGIAIARELGSPPPPTGIPSRALLALARHVPINADAFLLSDGYPEEQIASNAMWLRFSGDALEITGRVEGSAPGAAQKWLHGFVEGIEQGAAEKQITVDKSWFKESVADPVATIEARIPLEVFKR